MALLQISEPGESPAPHQRRIAIGIDLGTTNSLVATVRNSIAVVLNDEEGHPLLPSIVRYLPDDPDVHRLVRSEGGKYRVIRPRPRSRARRCQPSQPAIGRISQQWL